MNWKNRIQQPRFRTALCITLTALILVSLLAPGIPLKPMEQTDPLAQQEIREIEPVRLGDEADGSNAIIIPIEGGEDAEQTLEVSEGDGTAGEGEAQTGETRPEELLPVEVEGDEIDQEQNSTGSGDQGQEDGNSGEEGGELIQPDLAAVMLWERYGSDITVVCTPYQTVAATVNMAQLDENLLHYEFYLTGTDMDGMEITSVRVSSGNDVPRETDLRGQVEIDIPEGEDSRTWFFWLEAEGKNADGEKMTVSFTYVLKCENRLDLNLVLEWEKYGGETGAITCRADATANRTVDSGDLEGGIFRYTPKLTGSKAEEAQLISGKYTTLSGDAGELNITGGTLQLTIPEAVEAQIYDLFFEAEVGDRVVTYKISLHYRDVLSVRLNVTWFAGDTVPVSKICQSGDTLNYTIRTSEVRNGSARFTLTPEGEDAQEAVFLSVSYQGSDGTGGSLSSSQGPSEPFSFQLPVALGNSSANTYTITALMLAEGKNLTYTIHVKYASDMSLEMVYSLADGTRQQIVCESGDEKQAEVIYSDQLTDGMLHYIMTARNADGQTVPIQEVTCYQSGDLRNKILNPEDSIALLLADGKTGENTFTVTAKDGEQEYTFKINIPYKPRGQKIVKIRTNLEDGGNVINEIVNNFSVYAWVEPENGKAYPILNGNGQRLTVTMDGEVVPATTHSGSTMEYDLVPKNPETGDTNLHTIRIEAEDEYGNSGELELTLRGNRRMPGQVLGKATIRVDMTVLGKGIESVEYTVLTNEPVSVSLAKAVWGHDYGEPFGKADKTLGWKKSLYEGTLEEGFYLSRLYYGGSVGANALPGGSWSDYGSASEEILSAIDGYFGEGTALASLWRCLYRNDLEKAEGAVDSVGEFDYTNGSGWIYSLNGGYFPGESMCAYFLRDGDMLTLTYTLAYGWDVGSGTPGYEGIYGYCAWAEGGRLRVSHNWTENDGYSECSHCGLRTYCTHPDTACRAVDEHYHERYCIGCGLTVESDLPHIWSDASAADSSGHSCEDCGYTQEHRIHTESDDAYCDRPGTITESCWDCSYSQTETVQKDHVFGSDHYAMDDSGHWRFCNLQKSDGSECNEPGPRENHTYVYYGYGIWICSDCEAEHGMEVCEDQFLTDQEPTASDSEGATYHCDICNRDFRTVHAWSNWDVTDATCTQAGSRTRMCDICDREETETIDPVPHDYVDGFCSNCGESDPENQEPDHEPESGGEEVSLFAWFRSCLSGGEIREDRI